MKKSYFVTLLLAFLTIGTNAVWGDSFTIAFKSNASDGSTELTTTNFAEQITDGTAYCKSVSSLSKVYAGTNGLKLGSSKAAGSFLITLNQAYKITNVTINAVKFSSDKGNIKCGTSSTNATQSDAELTTSATACSFNLDGSEVSTIHVATSTKRAYISSIVVTYESGTTKTTLSLTPKIGVKEG